MYTGEFPYEVKKLEKLVRAKSEQDPDPPSKYWKEIPPALEAVIMRCIARDPAKRFASAEQLLQALEQIRA